MPSFSIPLSGLMANQEALASISNNLANLNTTAYKGVDSQFTDLMSQQFGYSGAGDPIASGLGTRIGSTTTDFSQGNVQNTGVNTDLAIQGDGFLQVQNAGLSLYTRNGNLSINAAGNLVTQSGAQVMGFPAVNGTVNPSGTTVPLQISPGQTNPAKATSNIGLTMNLNASANVGDTFSTSVAAYDSLGNSHVLAYNFTKTATNAWSYQITVPAVDVGGTGNPVVLNSGSLTFDNSGKLTVPAADVSGITATKLADGAADLNFTWNLYNSNKTPDITQVAAPSATTASQQDGYATGSLLNFTVGADGTIQGSFSNGQIAKLGQVALATFPNSEGLLSTGGGNYVATLSSGLPSLGVPGTGGRGPILDGALENSNVDISTEFAKLILAQRGYEASARSFTTQNTIFQDTISLGQ